MRERENLFNDFLDELRRKEKDEKHQRKEQVRKPLNLNTSMKYHTRWTDLYFGHQNLLEMCDIL